MLKVYLAGKIYDQDPYFERWREEVEEWMINHDIVPMNPMRHTVKPGERTAEDIVFRDTKMVDEADLLLVNLKLTGDTGRIAEPIVGTFFEMALAWKAQKPVLTIIDKDHDHFKNHPFIAAATTHFYTDAAEALDHIQRYWNWQYHARIR